MGDDEKDDLARRARDRDQEALGQLWKACEAEVRLLSETVCFRMRSPHRQEDAFEKAMEVFVFDAVPTYDENRGHFRPHVRQRLWDRLRSWLIREGRTENNPEIGKEPGAEEPSTPAAQRRLSWLNFAERLLNGFEGTPEKRNKWLLLRLLNKISDVTLREATDALALSSLDLEDPIVRRVKGRWETTIDRWLWLSLSMPPPPLPETWTACVELFCSDPKEAPSPPDRDALTNPTMREDELRTWYQRVRRQYVRVGNDLVGGDEK